jgi:hypothetical protein
VLLIRYRVSSVWLILAGGAIGILDQYPALSRTWA